MNALVGQPDSYRTATRTGSKGTQGKAFFLILSSCLSFLSLRENSNKCIYVASSYSGKKRNLYVNEFLFSRTAGQVLAESLAPCGFPACPSPVWLLSEGLDGYAEPPAIALAAITRQERRYPKL